MKHASPCESAFMHCSAPKLASALVAVALAMFAPAAHADLQFFNSTSFANALDMRTMWLTAVGARSPQHLVDFEAGFVNGQNISGVTNLFPAKLVIVDSSPAASVLVRTGSGVAGGSNPIEVFCITHNEQPYLVLDFAARPVDYVGVRDIDHTGTLVRVTLADDSVVQTTIETTGSTGNTAEFFGVFRNDLPRITRIEFDASGDNTWGLDNIEYGVKCPADINDDGEVNVTDLLAVIGAWGACVDCPASLCAADIAPIDTGGDCVVNVTDLLAVIGAWGPCT